MVHSVWKGAVVLFLFMAVGCGGGGAESPKVENSNMKPKSAPLKNKPGDPEGSSFRAE